MRLKLGHTKTPGNVTSGLLIIYIASLKSESPWSCHCTTPVVHREEVLFQFDAGRLEGLFKLNQNNVNLFFTFSNIIHLLGL